MNSSLWVTLNRVAKRNGWEIETITEEGICENLAFAVIFPDGDASCYTSFDDQCLQKAILELLQCEHYLEASEEETQRSWWENFKFWKR